MSTESMNSDENKESITALNSLLRGEISAAETYNQAITKMRNDPVPELIDNHNSHRQRVEVLRNQILQLGGTPAESSGVWGAMAKLVQGGAKLFGRQAALAALEEGEDRGLKDYRDSLGKLDPESRRVIERNLLPAQERTHRTMSDLKHQHAGGSSMPNSSL